MILGWIISCCTEAQEFWMRELESFQLQLTLVRLMHKLSPVCQKLWSHAHGRRDCYRRVVADVYSMTIKAICFPLGKINNDSLSKIGKEQYKKHVISEITKTRKEIILINSEIKR